MSVIPEIFRAYPQDLVVIYFLMVVSFLSRVLFIFFLAVTFAGTARAGEADWEITPDEIMSHIRYLASDELEGRMTGSEGNEKAARYIAGQYKKAGLSPLGDDGTYFQIFSFPAGVAPGGSNSVELSLDGRERKLEMNRDFFPLGSSANGEAAGEIVFAGYGISAPELDYDDYEGVDVRGKIVLVLRPAPEGLEYESPFYGYAALRYKAFNAREKGASAVIFTTPPSDGEKDGPEGTALDASTSDSGIPAVMITREVAREILSGSGRDLADLERTLSEGRAGSFPIPGSRVRIRADMVREDGTSANVLGLLEGKDPLLKNEVVVIGAHYDHIGMGERDSRAARGMETGQIHNGADDNASGVAGLLELSEFFSQREEKLKRSLLFIAFSGEEIGLLGSSYYIEHPKVPAGSTVAMINMDMIGRLDDDNLIVFGTGSSPEWQELIERANSGPKLKINFQSSPLGPSDQSVFYADEIPAIQFFTGLHSDYHTPHDDWEKIRPRGEEKVLTLISSLIEELARSRDRIAFAKSDEKPEGESRFKVYLGTIPDYAGHEDGVRLRGVREGSPAYRAGIRGGDTVVELDGQRVKNIYDYSYALGRLKAGVPASMVVMRGGKRVVLEIVPEER